MTALSTTTAWSPTTAPGTATAPAPASAPSPPARGIRARPGWDPVRFAATAPEREDEPADIPDRLRLVWSKGRARQLPDPQTWSGSVARACVETLHGSRPAAQLARWLEPEVWTALNRRAELAAEMRSGPARNHAVQVRRVRPCRVSPGVWESAVILHDGSRVRAAAVRLESHRGHWRVTAVQIG